MGLKTNVAQNDPSLFKQMDREGYIWAVHATEGRFFTLNRVRNSCQKSTGRATWSNSSCTTPAP